MRVCVCIVLSMVVVAAGVLVVSVAMVVEGRWFIVHAKVGEWL